MIEGPEHSFGLLNRLASQSYTHVGARELPSIDSITYAYTPNGSLQTVIETKTTFTGPLLEQTTRGFDALERMTSQTRDYGSTQKTTLFGYDVKGNRTSVTDFTGAGTVYTFDSVDRLKTATTPNGIATHVYFADGLLQRTEYRASAGAPVTTLEKRCYDNASRLTTVASGPPNFMGDDCPATMGPVVFSRFDYALDANGNRIAQREQRAAGVELTDYGYDALDRLVAVAYPSEAVLYQLDAVGNRTGEKKTTRVAAQALGLVAAAFAALAPADTLANVRGDFNRADWLTARRTLSANGLSELSRIDFGHDANGNTTREDTTTSSREYRWDARNTLTAALIDGTEVGRYSYDFQLQRVSRTAGGATTKYVLDDKLVLQELDGAGHAATRRYHFGALSPLGVSDSGGPRWLLNDGLGSVSDEVTPSGALSKQRQYNAWGEYRNSTAPAVNEPKLGYEGHQYDSETSLTYARARYLDNRYGVLLSRDAVEGNVNDAPSLHRYTWARSNPLRYTDPSGNVEIPVVIPSLPTEFDLRARFAAAQDIWEGAKEWYANTYGVHSDGTPLTKDDVYAQVSGSNPVSGFVASLEAGGVGIARMAAAQTPEEFGSAVPSAVGGTLGALSFGRSFATTAVESKAITGTLAKPMTQVVSESASKIGTAVQKYGQYLDPRNYSVRVGVANTPPGNIEVKFNPRGAAEVVADQAPNAALADLGPSHPRAKTFQVRAGELANNENVVQLHPTNELQMKGGPEVGHGGVQNLTNEQLMMPGGPQGNDPIRGFRQHGALDSDLWPGSEIHVRGGHHRIEEIGRRVREGKIDPNTLVEVRKAQ